MLTEIKQKISDLLDQQFAGQGLEVSFIELIERPKDLNHGHISLPVFQLAKVLRQGPPVIAKNIKEFFDTKNLKEIDKVECVGGYVNFTFTDEFAWTSLLDEVAAKGDQLGHSSQYKGKKVIIDYSSPNVAKPMHIGHLRATVIGQAIRNMAESQGYTVVGINHLGDWGSQFGKLCFAYEKWGSQFDFKKDAFESLYKLYVKFHDEAGKDPALESEGAAYFKRLEEGDPKLIELWKNFISISMADFQKNWSRLGVKHDLVLGESFYNDKMDPIVEELKQKKLLVESQGALVVPMDEEGIPPCLIRKTDGASLYATRDLATAIYRMTVLKADLNLYVVGADQALHFKQVFEVLRKMGNEWVKNCHHIGFGLVRFKDMGKISSRKGQIIRFSDVLDKAVELVKELIKTKNPDLKGAEADDVAEKVAIGSIVFNDLVNDRVKNVEFDWERALSFDGDSGPYVQYVYVRCESILNKWNQPVNFKVDELNLPNSDVERYLVRLLLGYPEVLSSSFEHFKPNIIANYLLDVCGAYNRFYHNHRILTGEEEFRPARIALVAATQNVIRSGLKVLNIPLPSRM